MNSLLIGLAKLGAITFLGTAVFTTTVDKVQQKEWEEEYRQDVREIILNHPSNIKITDVQVLTEEERQEWLENGIQDKGFNNGEFIFEYGKKGQPKNMLIYQETETSEFLRPENQAKAKEKREAQKQN